jgi:hypothetical protein
VGGLLYIISTIYYYIFICVYVCILPFISAKYLLKVDECHSHSKTVGSTVVGDGYYEKKN